MTRLQIEGLETRDVPSSASLLGATLFVDMGGKGDHVASVDLVNSVVQTVVDGKTNKFDPASINSIFVLGDADGRNVVQNNTALPFTAIGGGKDDTIFGGTGTNLIKPGKGDDVVYALLGTNFVLTNKEGVDRVFSNAGAFVTAGKEDLVVRFFGTGRTPGTPFLGLDPSLNDNVLYITPSNNGSSVVLSKGPKGATVVTYDLGDGTGKQVQTFTGLKAVAYFGGAGNDVYVNDTKLVEAAYGSAGNDTLIGGTGAFSLLKGSGGNDTLIGRAKHNDLSGNGGADLILALTQGRRDIFRTDPTDWVAGQDKKDVFISP